MPQRDQAKHHQPVFCALYQRIPGRVHQRGRKNDEKDLKTHGNEP